MKELILPADDYYSPQSVDTLTRNLANPKCKNFHLLKCRADLAIAIFTAYPGHFSMEVQFAADRNSKCRLFYSQNKLWVERPNSSKREELHPETEFVALYIKRER